MTVVYCPNDGNFLQICAIKQGTHYHYKMIGSVFLFGKSQYPTSWNITIRNPVEGRKANLDCYVDRNNNQLESKKMEA